MLKWYKCPECQAEFPDEIQGVNITFCACCNNTIDNKNLILGEDK